MQNCKTVFAQNFDVVDKMQSFKVTIRFFVHGKVFVAKNKRILFPCLITVILLLIFRVPCSWHEMKTFQWHHKFCRSALIEVGEFKQKTTVPVLGDDVKWLLLVLGYYRAQKSGKKLNCKSRPLLSKFEIVFWRKAILITHKQASGSPF